MDWSGVDYCDVCIRLSFWRHPFTAEHALLRHIYPNLFPWRNMLIYILAGLRPVLFLGCFVEQDQKAVQHTDVLQCVLIRLCVIVALVLYSAEIFWAYIHETCIAGKLFYGSDVRIKDKSSSSARVVAFFLHAAGFYDLFTDGFV